MFACSGRNFPGQPFLDALAENWSPHLLRKLLFRLTVLRCAGRACASHVGDPTGFSLHVAIRCANRNCECLRTQEETLSADRF